MGSGNTDFDDVKSISNSSELIKSHLGSHTKSHSVKDAQGRIFLEFTASWNAKEGDACIATEYVYDGVASTLIIGVQERFYKWKATWDSGFTFDPTVSYDPDGDGVL
jgi:hypothetical protein